MLLVADCISISWKTCVLATSDFAVGNSTPGQEYAAYQNNSFHGSERLLRLEGGRRCRGLRWTLAGIHNRHYRDVTYDITCGDKIVHESYKVAISLTDPQWLASADLAMR